MKNKKSVSLFMRTKKNLFNLTYEAFVFEFLVLNIKVLKVSFILVSAASFREVELADEGGRYVCTLLDVCLVKLAIRFDID
jgi:hypothetical protein